MKGGKDEKGEMKRRGGEERGMQEGKGRKKGDRKERKMGPCLKVFTNISHCVPHCWK